MVHYPKAIQTYKVKCYLSQIGHVDGGVTQVVRQEGMVGTAPNCRLLYMIDFFLLNRL